MTGRPFRTPFLRRDEGSGHEDGVLEPQAKKRRISNDREEDVKTKRPHLVFKTPGLSSFPRKPLSAIANPAEGTEPLDGELESFYNVLWYVRLRDERTHC